MALKSRTQILNEEANAEGASSEAILMAALNESQQEYKRLSGKLLLACQLPTAYALRALRRGLAVRSCRGDNES